jgi:hypothetical protein
MAPGGFRPQITRVKATSSLRHGMIGIAPVGKDDGLADMNSSRGGNVATDSLGIVEDRDADRSELAGG